MAVNLLDERIPGHGVKMLLFDAETRAKCSERLAAIATDIDLWDATDEDLERANDLWDFVGNLVGQFSDTRRSKLIARKRPRLVPIIDDVLKEAIVRPDGTDFWSGFRAAFQARPDFVQRLTSLGDGIRPVTPASPLRVLDAALWTRHSPQAQRYLR